MARVNRRHATLSFFNFNSSAGSVLTEFALVIPVFLLITFGTIQYGQIFYAQLTLRNAASIAARYAALGDPATPPSSSDVQTTAENALGGALDPANLTFNVDFNHALPSGDTARRVTLSYSLDLMLPFVVPGHSNGTLTLSADSTMR